MSHNDTDSGLVPLHHLSTTRQTRKKTHRGSREEDIGMAIIEERRVVQVEATIAIIFWFLFNLLTNHLNPNEWQAYVWLIERLMASPFSEHDLAPAGCFRNHSRGIRALPVLANLPQGNLNYLQASRKLRK